MDDYIEWEDRFFRREAIDCVSMTSNDEIVVFFNSGKERFFSGFHGAARAKFMELTQKVAGTWLEDDKPPQNDAETGPGAFVVESWGEITAGNS